MDHFEKDLVDALKDVVEAGNWQCVGDKSKFKSPCTKFYSDDGEHIVLVHTKDDQFWAMDSSCPHEGGPLEQGDIEDLGHGKLALICPWHYFDFSLETGSSSTGLQNQVYDVRVLDGKVYINTQSTLSLCPIPATKITHQDGLPVEITSSENTLCMWATKILHTADPQEKVSLTKIVQENWDSGKITETGEASPPAQPNRKDSLTVVEPGKIKRGKGGTLASRIALLHSLANIEQWAIDLSWDVIARFSTFRLSNGEPLPRQFFDDFVKVAGDEAKVLTLIHLTSRFNISLFSFQKGLWQSATDTSHDLLARLAIVHMVHEARGLDVHPQTLSRFAAQGDTSSVKVLEVIYADEITHVAAGLRWFTYICSKEGRDSLKTFHELVKLHFKGFLKPPFNTEGRRTAGMTEEWYVPLVKPSSSLQKTS
uniref:Rieske domain-containing protein n=1 Tax=Sinocyclocheilus rhinocerous TaxID=307959 RepID=A0A673KJM3_9TELE